MKHRGTYYINGLGMNDKSLGIVVSGVNPIMLTREELDINEWKKTLIGFDNSFVGYFEYIMGYILPADFINRLFICLQRQKVYAFRNILIQLR